MLASFGDDSRLSFSTDQVLVVSWISDIDNTLCQLSLLNLDYLELLYHVKKKKEESLTPLNFFENISQFRVKYP